MSENAEFDVDAAAVADRRAEVLSRVTEHAGRVARELALLHGSDDGRETFDVDGGSWTLAYEAGDVQYLRFEPRSGAEIYVVSTKRPAESEELATALARYDAFVEAFDRYVASYEGILDDVPTEFPDVASTAELVAERDRILGRIREVADAMAGELHRVDGGYGTFSTTVDGTRWELKWEDGRASYLRIGGSSGTYLLSQYEPPAAADIRRLAPELPGFVDAYNDHVAELGEDLASVSLSDR